MIPFLFAAFVSLVPVPGSWKKVPPTKPERKIGFGTAVAQYAAGDFGVVQVRMENCHGDKDLCDEFSNVTTSVGDYADAACKGKFFPMPAVCRENLEPYPPNETHSNPPAWSDLDIPLENGDGLYVFVMNRRKSEKKLYVFIYAGPKTGALDFVKYTDKLKTKGM